MDSDDDGFPKQGGEALEIGEDFDSEEEADDMPQDEDADAMRKPMAGAFGAATQDKDTESGAPGGAKPDIKGVKVEN